MEQDIQDVIKKHMPEVVGKLLQSELIELEKFRNNEPLKDKRITDQSARINGLEHQLKQHAALATREEAVIARELTADTRERNVQVSILTIQLAESERRNKDLFDLAGVFFRGPVSTRSVQGTVPIPVEGMAPGGSNHYGSPGNVLQSDVKLTETRTG